MFFNLYAPLSSFSFSPCRSRAFCADTGTSSGCSSPARSPTPTSSARPPTWRHRSRRSTAATASKATLSTWTARATQTYSDRTARSCEGWAFFLWLLPRCDEDSSSLTTVHGYWVKSFFSFPQLFFFYFFKTWILSQQTELETKDTVFYIPQIFSGAGHDDVMHQPASL